MILYVYLIRKKFIRGIVSLIEFFFLSCAVVYLPLSYALQFITVSDYQLKYTIPVSVVVIGIERVIACATADVNAKIAECISKHETLVKAIWSNLVFSLIIDICIIILTVSSHIFGHWTLVTCGLLSGSWVTVAAICNILDTAAIRNIKNNDRNRI